MLKKFLLKLKSSRQATTITEEQKQLLEFLKGKGNDIYDRDINFIWEQDRAWLEYMHNYIQWLFPLREESQFAYSIPLTDAMVNYIKSNETILKNIKVSFVKMLEFYGFSLQDGEIVQTMSEQEMVGKWLNPNNHNLLRITRIIGCLSIVGLNDLASKWLVSLEEVLKDRPGFEKTKEFWRDAETWK